MSEDKNCPYTYKLSTGVTRRNSPRTARRSMITPPPFSLIADTPGCGDQAKRQLVRGCLTDYKDRKEPGSINHRKYRKVEPYYICIRPGADL